MKGMIALLWILLAFSSLTWVITRRWELSCFIFVNNNTDVLIFEFRKGRVKKISDSNELTIVMIVIITVG